MDEVIEVDLTLEEARVLLVAVLHALEGDACKLDHPGEPEAANAAAAKLQNRISQCAMDPAMCASPRRQK